MRSKAGKRRRLSSSLAGIAGIGPKTQKLLLEHLGGLERLRLASDAELLAIKGVTQSHLRALKAHFAQSSAAQAPDSSDAFHGAPEEQEDASEDLATDTDANAVGDP
jgi:ERCC4-type nuclease